MLAAVMVGVTVVVEVPVVWTCAAGSLWVPLPQAPSRAEVRAARLRTEAVRKVRNFMILGKAAFMDELL
jgi:hypothetical protein